MVDFSSLLKKPAYEAKKPEALPVSPNYPGVIKSYELLEGQNEKKLPFVRFMVGLTGWADDIDQTDRVGDPSKRTLRRDYYLTDEALYRLDLFLKSLGLASGQTYDELLPQVVGARVIVSVKQYMNQRTNEIGNEVAELTGA